MKDTQFKKGQVANPKGRPKGSRNKLSEDFITALYDDFKQFGKEAICLVREERTDAYLNVIAKLVPKEMHLKVDPLEDFTDEQLNAKARDLIEGLFGAGEALDGVKEAKGQKQIGELPPIH